MKNWKWKEQNEEWRVKQYKRLEKNDSRRLKYPLSWKTIKMSFIIQYQDVWALFPKCWDDECLKRQKKDMMLKMLTQGKGQVWRNNAVLLLREARAADISKKLEDYASKEGCGEKKRRRSCQWNSYRHSSPRRRI